SLIGVLIAASVTAATVLALSAMFANTFRGAKHVETRAELEGIRQLLIGTLDCDATFAANGITNPMTSDMCVSTSETHGQNSATKLRLVRRSRDSQAPMGVQAADGSYKMGTWSIRATCSRDEQTLVVRAARKRPGGGYLTDPLTGEKQNW